MSFWLRHIDSLIQLGLGLAFTWMGFRRTGQPASRAAKVFRVCGPALVIIGGLLLFQPDGGWQRQFTADRMASAEFPGAPTAMESTDTQGAVTIKRTSLQYNVRGKDIALFLSYSPLPEQARPWTDEQRFAATVASMTSQGSKILRSGKDPAGPIYRLTVRQDEKKATLQMAIAYVDNNVYRVVASWIDGEEDQPLTDRFVSSFSIDPPR